MARHRVPAILHTLPNCEETAGQSADHASQSRHLLTDTENPHGQVESESVKDVKDMRFGYIFCLDKRLGFFGSYVPNPNLLSTCV